MKIQFYAAMRSYVLLSLFLLICAPTKTFAQRLDFKFGPAQENGLDVRHFNAPARQGYIFVREKKNIKINIVDDYITPGKTITWAEWMGSAHAYFTSNGKSYVILSDESKETKLQKVSIQEIGPDFQPIGKPTLITTFKDVSLQACSTHSQCLKIFPSSNHPTTSRS